MCKMRLSFSQENLVEKMWGQLKRRYVFRIFLLTAGLTVVQYILSTPSITMQPQSDAEKNYIKQKQADTKYSRVFNVNHTITLEDLSDLTFPSKLIANEETWDQAAATRQPILDLLTNAGLSVNLEVLQRLPTWNEITDLYGPEPVIIGEERCQIFRESVPSPQRFVGVAGQMNTGTNALSKYLLHNVVINENRFGVLWTVPWFKHGWASLKQQYLYRPPRNHSLVMAIVTVKDPYFWMRSMCESPYTLEWEQDKQHCPTLLDSNSSVPVTIKWGTNSRRWQSLAHVWSSWYQEYVQSDMPRLMIRYEDLLLRPRATINKIRQCVGGHWIRPDFQWQAAPAKTHPYFAKYKAPSSLISALIKYGNDGPRRMGTMNEEDVSFARMHLDKDLMELFQYRQPATAQ